MDLFNILAVHIDTIGEIKNVIELDWLGKLIQSLIEGCNSIGLGIIVFTLILKIITLPFDIFSRVSTKKSSVMMEKMRPELERLQRQYANNSDLYQRKMQDLYKKNGYSPFSACLPTLLNLVIFIVVIGQFSTYSNYANFGVFCDMSVAYEIAVNKYDELNDDNELNYVVFEDVVDEKTGEVVGKSRVLNLKSFYEGKYGEAIRAFNMKFTATNETFTEATLTLLPDVEKDTVEYKAMLKALYDELEKGANGAFAEYVPGEKQTIITLSEDGVYAFATDNETGINAFKAEAGNVLLEYYANDFINEHVKEVGRVAAAEKFRNTELSFLWVKNIWSQDIPWEHPVKEDFAQYNFIKQSGCFATCSASCNGEDNTIRSVTEVQYDELTAGLKEEKSAPNGYLILVVLSIGTMLIQQVIMQKQNKTQTELGSVGGENSSAAQSQKMMTWMMPIMFGFFSFMYTASFSIYIVISSLFSLASNLIINKLTDKHFEKLALIDAKNEELRRTGRINQIQENNKNKKNKK